MGYVEDLRGKKQGQGRPRWRARYRDPSGRERSKSFGRKVDAEQFLVGIEDTKLRGAYVDPQLGRVLFGEWAERWFRTTADLKPSSRRTYRKLLDNQILPTFGRAGLGGIDTLAVREWIAGLVEQGLSPSRIRNAHQVLSQILAAGVEGGRIARNPAAGVRLPRVVRRDMHFLTARQAEYLAAAIDPRYWLLVRFAAYTGLRADELGGAPRPVSESPARPLRGQRVGDRGGWASGVGTDQDLRQPDGASASVPLRAARRLSRRAAARPG